MTPTDKDRLENAVSELRSESTAIREALAKMSAQLENWSKNEQRSYHAFVDLNKEVQAHMKKDAKEHASMLADIKRLWWGMGIGLTAALGSSISFLFRIQS